VPDVYAEQRTRKNRKAQGVSKMPTAVDVAVMVATELTGPIKHETQLIPSFEHSKVEVAVNVP
jgi:hypothetical protein